MQDTTTEMSFLNVPTPRLVLAINVTVAKWQNAQANFYLWAKTEMLFFKKKHSLHHTVAISCNRSCDSNLLTMFYHQMPSLNLERNVSRKNELMLFYIFGFPITCIYNARSNIIALNVSPKTHSLIDCQQPEKAYHEAVMSHIVLYHTILGRCTRRTQNERSYFFFLFKNPFGTMLVLPWPGWPKLALSNWILKAEQDEARSAFGWSTSKE